MNLWHQILRYSLDKGVPKRSLAVAFIVGTLLNLINQADVLLNGMPLNWWKIVLTYTVPYCVATYGAVALRIAEERKRLS